MGKGKEGEGGKGRTPVPDFESAKVATLNCGGPPTMPEENRGPWSKKFENRWCVVSLRNVWPAPLCKIWKYLFS